MRLLPFIVAAFYASVALRCDPRSAQPEVGPPDAASPPAELVGFWVWRSVREHGHAVRIVTDQDMEPRVGPSGWPGCPEWYICTHFGIHALALGPEGEFWLVNNVLTSSDFQQIGTYVAADGVLTVARQRFYSCAHPDRNYTTPATLRLRYRMENDELWVSTDAEGDVDLASSPQGEPDSWMVFRRVTEQDFLDRYLLRRCQDDGRDPRCFEGCFSEHYGR
jgi:hypothetical protein